MPEKYEEEEIRKAMIEAGYGEGFSINLEASGVAKYVYDIEVSRILREKFGR